MIPFDVFFRKFHFAQKKHTETFSNFIHALNIIYQTFVKSIYHAELRYTHCIVTIFTPVRGHPQHTLPFLPVILVVAPAEAAL